MMNKVCLPFVSYVYTYKLNQCSKYFYLNVKMINKFSLYCCTFRTLQNKVMEKIRRGNERNEKSFSIDQSMFVFSPETSHLLIMLLLKLYACKS